MIAIIINKGFDEVGATALRGLLSDAGLDARTVSTDGTTAVGRGGLQIKCDLVYSQGAQLFEAAVIPDGDYEGESLTLTEKIIAEVLGNSGRIYAIGKGASLLPSPVGTEFGDCEQLLREGNTVLAKSYEALVKAVIEDKDKPLIRDFTGYQAPSKALLGTPLGTEDHAEEIRENTVILERLFEQYKVKAEVERVVCGPRVARYEVRPERGVKVTSILRLIDDISLTVCVEGIRIEAPIPGKSLVGIEIPFKKAEPVFISELLSDHEFESAASCTTVALGKDVTGTPIFSDLAKMPHLLVAGATGMGKSNLLNLILTSIIYKSSPSEVRFILIDPKQVEFYNYRSLPHLLTPVITSPTKAAAALTYATEEMERRYELLSAARVRNINEYNSAAKENGKEPLPRIIIVIDELADLMLQVKDPIENYILRITQKARAAGIHLILGTQRPTVNVITGVIKANVPSRICFKVASVADSRTALDTSGAERLLSRGDMLFYSAGSIHPSRIQAAYISEREIESIVADCAEKNGGACYDVSARLAIERIEKRLFGKEREKPEVSFSEDEVIAILESAVSRVKRETRKKQTEELMEKDSEIIAKYFEGYEPEENAESGILLDKTFIEAVTMAVEAGKVSTSLIQRKLSVGYGKAAKYIDYMEDMGIVSPADGQKPRTVLLSPKEWEEKLDRITEEVIG